MKPKTVTITFPVEVFSVLKKTPKELSKDIRLAAAVKWYEIGVISQEKAAEIAGMCREDFIMSLARFKVSPFQYSAEEILHEAGYD